MLVKQYYGVSTCLLKTNLEIAILFLDVRTFCYLIAVTIQILRIQASVNKDNTTAV